MIIAGSLLQFKAYVHFCVLHNYTQMNERKMTILLAKPHWNRSSDSIVTLRGSLPTSNTLLQLQITDQGLLLLLLLLLLYSLGGPDWTGSRGPDGQGLGPEVELNDLTQRFDVERF